MENHSSERVEKFMRFEHIFFRVQLSLLGAGFFILGAFYFVIDKVKDVNNLIAFVIYAGLLYPVLHFFISIVRIIKYLRVIRHDEGPSSIWRSALSFLFSPLTFAIFYIILIVLVFASCAANV